MGDHKAKRPRFEVADVVRQHGVEYCQTHHPTAAQRAVLRHIGQCRTAELGGHVEQCGGCGQVRVSYNSCRDRHCPKCQGLARGDWLDARLGRLLPVPYFHVVFTLPSALHAVALGNPRVVFGALFAAAAATLKILAADDKHLGADIGFTAVLHTWGQNLLFHPHLHCVVTGGGLSGDGERWVQGRERFFLPVKVLGRLFRGKMIAALTAARERGELSFGGSTAELAEKTAWKTLLNELYRQDWVVYAKPPFGGAEQVFRYLGRYTHRVAISNHRLVAIDGGRVTFTLKDYRDGKRKRMTVSAVEFLRRFVLHVLPRGFTRIRHYGLLAGRNVEVKLARARELLSPAPGVPPTPAVQVPPPGAPWWQRILIRTGFDPMQCPHCGDRIVRQPGAAEPLPCAGDSGDVVAHDTS